MFMNSFWRGFFGAYIGAKVSEYYFEKEYEKIIAEVKEVKKRKRIEGLEDVLTEEEKEILMNMD